jgi:hypothetical protein
MAIRPFSQQRQYDPQLAAQINQLTQRGLDAHTAARQVLQAEGMDPVQADTWWSYNQGAYQVDPKTGQIGEHKAAIDNPWLKAAVLAPMIAGGGLAAASALGGGAAAAGSAPELGAGGESLSAGLGGAGAVGPGGGLAGTAGTAGGLGAAGDITGELGASTGTASGGVPQVLGGAGSKAGSLFGGAGGSSLMPYLLNAGMRVGGAAYGAHAAGKASEQQQQNVQKALDLQKSLYGQSQAALMPYYTMGAGSLGRLQSFLGTPSAAPLPSGTLGNLGK